MSAGSQLSRWANARERQRGERPRRHWRLDRASRHDREVRELGDQLELNLAQRPERGGGSTLPAPQDQVADLPPRNHANHPTPEECRLRPELVFD